MRALVVVAVDGEQQAIRDRLGTGQRQILGPVSAVGADVPAGEIVIIVGGVGMTAAAAATAAVLARETFDVALSVGIGGGFVGAPLQSIVVADQIVAAELGVYAEDGFQGLAAMGLGADSYAVPARWADEFVARSRTTGADVGVGPIVTVSTITSTAPREKELTDRYGVLAAEGMEGFGVAAAATLYGLPCAEIRTISNAIGPRDTSMWHISEAMDLAAEVVAAIAAEPWPW